MSLNKRNLLAAALLACSTVFMSSCKDDDDDFDYSMSNQEFVTRASSSNNFEIAAGGQAVIKGSNATVRGYGEHMVDDHGTTGQEMRNMAAQKGWTVTTDLQSKERDNLALLTPLTGTAFDREFARIMVASHEDAINLFESASKSRGVPDGDLRNWAESKLPVLRAHLEDAKDLRDAVNP